MPTDFGSPKPFRRPLPKRGSEEEKLFIAEALAKVAARQAQKEGKADVHVPVKRESDYPCPTVRSRSIMADRDWLPEKERDPNDPYEWKRRVWKVERLDFEGDHIDKSLIVKGTSLVALNVEVGAKLRLVIDQVCQDLFSTKNSISVSAMIDLLIRWFIQHPPSKDWAMAYMAEWLCSHKRGPKSVEDTYNPDVAWSQTGEFVSKEDFEAFLAKRKMDAKRAKRIKMEVGDLQFEDITSVEREHVKKGKLEVPKPAKPDDSWPYKL